ncbi:hypothetical protein FRB91_011117 [Serendipita sp. 411]|nr:hypothetical protein FRB91_011117 [Serendipita sp. 411]
MPWSVCPASWREVFIILWIFLHQANAAQSYIDDASPYVKYTGTWLTAVGPDHFFNTTHYTKVKGSTASLTFTGAIQVRLFGVGITNPAVDSMVGIIFDGTSISVSIARDENHYLRQTIWDSGTNLDPNVSHTLTCVKTSADGGNMDLYVDTFVLTPPDGTTVPVSGTTVPVSGATVPASGTTPTTTTSVTQTTSIIDSRPSSSPLTTRGSATADHSTLSNIALGLPIGSDDSMSPTAGVASTSETANIIAKDTGMSNAAKTGIALGALVFICLCSAIFFLLSRRKRISDSFTHLNPYRLDEINSDGCHDAGCKEPEQRTLAGPGIQQWRRGMDTDAVHGMNRASGTSTFTGSLPDPSLHVTGPPPYSDHSTSSDS